MQTNSLSHIDDKDDIHVCNCYVQCVQQHTQSAAKLSTFTDIISLSSVYSGRSLKLVHHYWSNTALHICNTKTSEFQNRDETEILEWWYRDETETFTICLQIVSRPETFETETTTCTEIMALKTLQVITAINFTELKIFHIINLINWNYAVRRVNKTLFFSGSNVS